jgi:protocatechuate 3,4-dioxygenase beta subunit
LRIRVLILAFAASRLLAADRASLAGKILDGAGHPIDHATVLVYHAGVKKGYSTYCPSCYVDCGKRTTTGPDGSFVIKGVDSGLLFELLAVRDGFQPAFIKAVDPLKRRER